MAHKEAAGQHGKRAGNERELARQHGVSTQRSWMYYGGTYPFDYRISTPPIILP
jgi:hypothetical protein